MKNEDRQRAPMIVGILGSPRRNGNSATLMRAVLSGAAGTGQQTTEVYLNGLSYQGCQACVYCTPGGECVVRDDLTPVISELRKAEGWVLAAPIYFDGVSGQLKMFFDRCRTFISDPVSHELSPQLPGKRNAVIIVTYEDTPRDDYLHEAEKLRSYLGWMGDFETVKIMAEANLGPAGAARGKTELLERARNIGAATFPF